MSVGTEEMLTVAEAARLMGMSPRYVRRLVAERRIPFHKMGRSVRLSCPDVVAHIEDNRVEPLRASDVWRHLREVA